MILTARDLLPADLGEVAWAGTPTHLRYVAASLERAARDEIDFVAVCDGNQILGIGAVDFVKSDSSAVLWQLNVHPEYQSQGVGTFLVGELERRATERGFDQVELAVEIDNPRAQALYKRLGYAIAETYADEWDEENAFGEIHRHTAVCTVMRKRG